MSTLGAQDVLVADLAFPPAGAWIANVTLASGGVPALGPTVLTIGDLVCVGAVVRAAEDEPGQPVAYVVGGAGWDAALPLPGGSYANPNGVRLSTVLRDLAALARYEGGPATGEAFVMPADASLGLSYGWRASGTSGVIARHVLADLIARKSIPMWRVDPKTGATRFDAWPALGAADARGRLGPRNLRRGRRTYALDTSVAAFLPGASVEGATIARLHIRETSGRLEAHTYEQ